MPGRAPVVVVDPEVQDWMAEEDLMAPERDGQHCWSQKCPRVTECSVESRWMEWAGL